MPKTTYYHIDDKLQKNIPKKGLIGFVICFLLLMVGVYVYGLTQSPAIIADNNETLKQKEDNLVKEDKNFIKISNLNLLIPFARGKEDSLSKNSVWWREPEQGNPAEGGNFILCGQRLKLAVTPSQTKDASTFYNLEKLNKNDKIDIYYEGQWYPFTVSSKDEKPSLEMHDKNNSQDTRLILYTCSPSGESDGHIAFIAESDGKKTKNNDEESGSNLLL